MARRSGWAVINQIAREIDRANRAQRRARIAHQNALIREEERNQRQALREKYALVKHGIRLQEQFNKSLNGANAAINLSVKENKMQEALANLVELKELSAKYDFVNLTNLEQVEDGIRHIEAEVDVLKNEQEKKNQWKNMLFTKPRKQKRHERHYRMCYLIPFP